MFDDIDIIDSWHKPVPEKLICRNCFKSSEWLQWFDEKAEEIIEPCSYGCSFESFMHVKLSDFVERCVKLLKQNFELANLHNEKVLDRHALLYFLDEQVCFESEKLKEEILNLLFDGTWLPVSQLP